MQQLKTVHSFTRGAIQFNCIQCIHTLFNMTIFTLAKTDTYRTNLPVLPKDVTKIQIVSRKVQQIAQLTGKWNRSQSGGKRFKLPRTAPFKYKLLLITSDAS
jgi:hypothetical protein